MEQKKEASQAVDERADMIAALSMCAAALAQGSSKRSRDIACEYACEALRRAALKAQPANIDPALLRALLEARDLAMKNTVAARAPECGDFGAIAQNLDYVISQLKAQPAPTEAARDRIPMPTNADQAELMQKLGLAWLQTNAPDRLTDAGRAAQGEDSARLDWKRITAPGQVKVGDKLRFTIGDEKFSERVKQIINPGYPDEEMIYNKRRNFYVITSNAITNFGSSKNVEFLARASAETGGVKL